MYLTIEQAARKMDCTIYNIYNHIKRGNLKTEKKRTFIFEKFSPDVSKYVETGEVKEFVLSQSIEEYLSKKGKKRRNAGKQIRATYTNGQLFENGEKSIVFKSEVLAQEGLELSKWTIRYRLKNGIEKDGLRLERI